MEVRSGNCELGYELVAAIPYAYSLHLQGLLTKTVSGTGSEAFYYFSPEHEIDPTPRDFAHTAEAAKSIPNMWIHKPKLDKANWAPPPYKKHYGPRAIAFEKPTVVIYNRYNREWDKDPINYFDLPTLRSLFTMLLPEHDIVYFNIRGQEALEDNAHSMDLGDYEMIAKEFPQVHIIHDLVEAHGGDYNDVQMRVFAACGKFITMNGAPSILASYFGGENIIYSKECRELRSSVNSFFNWYGDFGGSHIRLVNTYEDLLATVRSAWVDEDPLINILVRCHNRPKGLERLLASVSGYRNARVICSYDNEQTWRYVSKERVEKTEVRPEAAQKSPPGEEYKRPLPANLYFNEMYRRVLDGYIVFLDDDDVLRPGALEVIAREASEDRLLLWRVGTRTGGVVPDDEHWGSITAGQISGIGVCFHSRLIDSAQWEPWRRGDYRVIKALAEEVEPKWLDMELTAMGERIDNIPAAERMEQAKKAKKEAADELAKEVVRRKEEDKRIRSGESPLPFIQRRKQWLTNRRSRRP